MARIRTIKPEFFTSLDVADLSRDARLLFVGLWTHADDGGRGLNEPRLIKAALFPLDDDITPADVADLMEELCAQGVVSLYSDADKRRLFQVNAWIAHQRIDKPRPSKYQSPTDPGSIHDPSPSNPGSLPPEGKGREGKGPDRNDLDATIAERIESTVDAYVVSVCLAKKNTSASFREGVKRNAMKERAQIIAAYIAQHTNCSDNELLMLVGLGDPNIKPAGSAPDWYANPLCEQCYGDGLANLAPEGAPAVYGPCPCRQTNPYPAPLASVHELRPA